MCSSCFVLVAWYTVIRIPSPSTWRPQDWRCVTVLHILLGNVLWRVYAQLGEKQLPTPELLGSGKLFPPACMPRRLCQNMLEVRLGSQFLCDFSVCWEKIKQRVLGCPELVCPGPEAGLALQLLGMEMRKNMHKLGAFKASFLLWSQNNWLRALVLQQQTNPLVLTGDTL